MANFDEPLPPNVQEALDRGQALEAIKLLRLSSGMGLKEAKAAIDESRRHPSPAPIAEPAGAESRERRSATFARALGKGNPVEAIRALREQAGTGRSTADDAFENARRASQAGGDGPSPGEVTRASGGARRLIVVAVVLAVWIAWRFLNGPEG